MCQRVVGEEREGEEVREESTNMVKGKREPLSRYSLCYEIGGGALVE